MNRTILTVAAVLAAAAIGLAGLTPETLTITNARSDVSSYVSTNTYLTGTMILFTNCLACADTTNTVQDLTDCGIYVRVGSERTNLLFAGAAQIATNGTWTATVTIPDNASGDVRVQLTLTNGATSFTYRGDKMLYVRSPLD